jgi:hypothetical protein
LKSTLENLTENFNLQKKSIELKDVEIKSLSSGKLDLFYFYSNQKSCLMLKINLNLAINQLKKDLNDSVAYQRDFQQNLDETKSILNKLQEKTSKELNEIDVNVNNKVLTIKTEINRTVDKMGIICQK